MGFSFAVVATISLLWGGSTDAIVASQATVDSDGDQNTLTVEVTNGTGSESVADATPHEITLQAFNGDVEFRRWAEESDPNGSVRFEGLDVSPGLVYIASTVHRGVRYFADPVSLFDGVEGLVSVTIYEVTSDPSAIRISGDNMVLIGPDGDGGTISVMQVTTIENFGDRTFVGERDGDSVLTLRLPLPDQAFDVEALHAPGSLVIDPLTLDLYSTLPTLPGRDDLILTYRLLYQNGKYAFAKEYPYPTDVVRFLIPDQLSVELGDPWDSVGSTEVSGIVYETFEVQMADGSGRKVSALFTGLPISAGERSRDLATWFRYGGVGFGILVAVGAVGYGLLWSRARRDLFHADGEVRTLGLQGQTSGPSFADALAGLDADFEAGRIGEDEYWATRAEQVQALQRQLGGDPAL